MNVSMASGRATKRALGKTYTKVQYKEENTENLEFYILPDLYCDIILGLPFIKLHKELRVKLNGGGNILELTAVVTDHTSSETIFSPTLFENLSADCHRHEI
ncbi:hypothetical protein ACOME3_006950 [Neoechinorhynchus agilis]